MGFALRSDDNGIYENGTITFILIVVNTSIFITTTYLIIKTTAQLRGMFWKTFCCCLHIVNRKGKDITRKVSSVAIQPLKRKLSNKGKSDNSGVKTDFSIPPRPPPGPPPTAKKDTQK